MAGRACPLRSAARAAHVLGAHGTAGHAGRVGSRSGEPQAAQRPDGVGAGERTVVVDAGVVMDAVVRIGPIVGCVVGLDRLGGLQHMRHGRRLRDWVSVWGRTVDEGPAMRPSRTESSSRSTVGVLAALMVAAALVAVSAPSQAQPTNRLSGVWYGINQVDGSNPTVIVFGEGRTTMPVVFVDSIRVGCSGGPEITVGTARLAGDTIAFTNTTRYCANGQVLPNGAFDFAYDGVGRIVDATPPPEPEEVEYQKVCPNETIGDFTAGISGYQEGTNAGETLSGTRGNDVIDALGGNDTVRSGGGLDVVCGGAGRDTIRTGAGIDIVWGEGGVDIVSGGGASDVVVGGPGRDRLGGGPGNDWLFGGPSGDQLRGGGGNDQLDGGTGRDTLLGNAGRDVADGNAGRDRCVAEVERRCER